jgi:oligopeptide transport system ATP-binding protein
VRHVSHRVAVIYLGRIVEIGDSAGLFAKPVHPYSRALLSAAPSIDPDQKGAAIKLKGELPSPLAIPPGCAFHVRCAHATEICTRIQPQLSEGQGAGLVACHHARSLQ